MSTTVTLLEQMSKVVQAKRGASLSASGAWAELAHGLERVIEDVRHLEHGRDDLAARVERAARALSAPASPASAPGRAPRETETTRTTT